ncbi:MAG TPA: ferritin-like domain-containing protein [Saprospiraceae bacterium]|nr:ferritin-like domain-containing protein [Saprospiraceae bacterium]
MATTKTASKKTASKRTNPAKKADASNGMHSSQLMKLFEDELKDIYWAEKALTKAIPKMIRNATSADLIRALKNHLTETQKQVTRVEQVFKAVNKTPAAKKCIAMAGLIKEGEEIMKDCEKGPMRDAGIISAAQKVEHYEIASYGTLRQFAETLGMTRAAQLLQATLGEEKAADDKLTEVAVKAINVRASKEQE